jgi:GntR family transcriptional regulator
MLITLDFETDVPIYLQIKIQIIQGIATGKLKPGETLPSVRQFASDLGINLHTVNKAYSFLKQDGFIVIHRQKGVVVNPIGTPQITDEYLLQLKNDLMPLASEAFCRGMPFLQFNKICNDMFIELNNIRGENQ